MRVDGLLFREARFEDLPAIVHVFMGDVEGGHGDLWSEETRPAYEEAMRRLQASAANTLFVAEIGGAVIGTMQVTIIPGLVSRGRTRAKFESVHIRPEWRGKGIGEAMIRHGVAFAREQGAEVVELSSNKKRLAAHRFYERLGFSRSHEGFKLLL